MERHVLPHGLKSKKGFKRWEHILFGSFVVVPSAIAVYVFVLWLFSAAEILGWR